MYEAPGVAQTDQHDRVLEHIVHGVEYVPVVPHWVCPLRALRPLLALPLLVLLTAHQPALQLHWVSHLRGHVFQGTKALLRALFFLVTLLVHNCPFALHINLATDLLLLPLQQRPFLLLFFHLFPLLLAFVLLLSLFFRGGFFFDFFCFGHGPGGVQDSAGAFWTEG